MEEEDEMLPTAQVFSHLVDNLVHQGETESYWSIEIQFPVPGPLVPTASQLSCATTADDVGHQVFAIQGPWSLKQNSQGGGMFKNIAT